LISSYHGFSEQTMCANGLVTGDTRITIMLFQTIIAQGVEINLGEVK